jgi:3-dehydroquinate synthase
MSFIIDKSKFTPCFENKNKLTVTSHPENYDVIFESANLNFTDKDVVLIDSNVKRLYNISHKRMIEIDATEENKSMETALLVCEKLLNFHFDKGNTLIVIGGGILQDIGAFVSKMFKRGIKWTYYPTTLLSQCDSCIGGKTALNFKDFKNQLALFSAPQKVVIDTKFLETLSERDILSGHGEIVKLFLTGGEEYVDMFDDLCLDEKIYHSLAIKKEVVEKDEFELLERKSLNYGHSFGHSIESATNYSICHGEAVLLGIEIINQLFDNNPKITEMVEKFTSLSRLQCCDMEQVFEITKTDKKVKDGVITLVVVREPGLTEFVPTKIDEALKERVCAISVN